MKQDDETAPIAEGESPSPGGTIGRFVVVGSLGAGGMGVVLAAWDPTLERRVALKILKPGIGEGQVLLQREAQAMARISHPNVANVYEVGTAGEQLFVAMELVDGTTLKEWLREPRSRGEIVRMFVAAGRGLEAAHRAGLVHRDFKPENVLVGGDGRPRVTDFGLVSLSRAGDAVADGSTLDYAGTPAYMAPEQCRGEPTDARSDQFSFCVALYLALSGERPFPVEAPAEGRHAPERPHREIPAWLYAVIARGLKADPEARFPDLGALIEALSRDPGVARRRRLAAAAAVVIAGLSIFGVMQARSATCGRAGARLAGVWDEPVRRAVHQAFLAGGQPWAETTFAGVARRLDDYARDLTAMQDESCRATRLEGRQSDSLMDLRMACLEGRRAGLAALTSLWSKGVDGPALAHALDAASSLPRVSECADTRALTERAPLPADAAARAHIQSAREHLDQVRALIGAERWSEAQKQAPAARAEADATGWTQVRAEAALVAGRIASRFGEPSAEEALTAAGTAAGAAHDDRLAARALLQLVGYLANAQHNSERALLVATLTEGAVERAGGGDELRGLLALERGYALLRGEKLDEAKHSLVDAQRRLGAALDPADGLINEAAEALAHVIDMQGDYAGAQKLLQGELERVQAHVGPDHPRLAVILHHLGLVTDDLNDYPAAIDYYRRALAIDERSFGKDGLPVAMELENLATSEDNLERLADADRDYQRSLDIRLRALGPDHVMVGHTLGNLSGTRLKEGRFAEALQLATRSEALLRKQYGPDNPELGYISVLIGDAFFYQGELEQAAAKYRQAWELRKRGLGADHVETLANQSSLASTRCRQKRYDEGLALLADASARMKKAPGHQAQAGRVAASYGRCLTDAGRPSLGVLEEALSLSEQGHEPSSALAGIHLDHARALWAVGRKPEALTEARGAEAELAHHPLGPPAFDLAEARRFLATH